MKNTDNLMAIENFPALLEMLKTERVIGCTKLPVDVLRAEKAKASRNFKVFAEAGQIATANEWRDIEVDLDSALLLLEVEAADD